MDRREQEMLAQLLAEEAQQQPFPFPGRIGPVQDWERTAPGSVIGAEVGSRRPSAPPQRRRNVLPDYSQALDIIPWRGLADAGGYIAGQIARAPGRAMRGERLDQPPPANRAQQQFTPPMTNPDQIPAGEPPAFPTFGQQGMVRQPFAAVYDQSPGAMQDGRSRDPAYAGSRFAPPDAISPDAARAARDAQENQDWNSSVYSASAQIAAQREVERQRLNQEVEASAERFRRGGIEEKARRKGDGPTIAAGGGTLMRPSQVAQDQQDWMRGTNEAAPMVDPETGWPIDPLTGQPVAPIEWERMQREAAEQQRMDEERAARGNRWGVGEGGLTFRRRW